MLFWTVAALLALTIGGVLALALLRAQGGSAPAAAYDVAVYRDQLKEVERDLARGLIAEDEAERIRTEVARRLLGADGAVGAETGATVAPQRATLGAVAAVAALLGIGAPLAYVGMTGFLTWVGLEATRIEALRERFSVDTRLPEWMGGYRIQGTLVFEGLGAPGYSDLPLAARIAGAEAARAARPGQTEAETEFARLSPPRPATDAQFLDLMTKLRAAMTERPDDLRGQTLLAHNEARLGNFAAAHAAQAKVIALRGDAASAADYADLADLMVLAAGGYVSPQAEAALTQALELDARNGVARYYLGLMYAQTGRPDLGFQIWRALLAESTPQAPWVPPIRGQIEDLARLAGVRFQLPDVPPAPGPSAADITAAGDMSPEDRTAMIRSMVEGLGERLAAQGGTPEEWARLINAYAVLGEPERSAAIWAEAQETFSGAPDALATIRAAAIQAGVAE